MTKVIQLYDEDNKIENTLMIYTVNVIIIIKLLFKNQNLRIRIT